MMKLDGGREAGSCNGGGRLRIAPFFRSSVTSSSYRVKLDSFENYSVNILNGLAFWVNRRKTMSFFMELIQKA